MVVCREVTNFDHQIFKAMKITLRSKYIITLVFALSLFSFIYVNIHAAYSYRASIGNDRTKINQQVLTDEDDEKDQNIAVPDITILSRIAALAHRYLQTGRD